MRAATIKKIWKLVEYTDKRIKEIVSIIISLGIKLDALDYLKWKNIIPMFDYQGNVIAAKRIMYRDKSEEYFTFIWVLVWFICPFTMMLNPIVPKAIIDTTNIEAIAKYLIFKNDMAIKDLITVIIYLAVKIAFCLVNQGYE